MASFEAPTLFTLQAGSWHGQLNLSWTQGIGSQGTIIKRKKLSRPSSYSDGTLVYSGSMGTYIDNSLDTDAIYYYKAFAISGSTYSTGVLPTPAGLPGTKKKPYTKIIWQSSDRLNHPDLRENTNDGSGSIAVYINGDRAERVLNYNDFESQNQFFIDVNESNTIAIVMHPEFETSGSTIEYSYTTMCSCVNPKELQPDRKCTICYGTMWEGGYTYYTTSATSYKRENSILVVFPPVKEDYKIDDIQGKVKSELTTHWTNWETIVNDFDVIVGINASGSHYHNVFECVDLTRSDVRGQLLSQGFNTVYIEQDDIRYNLIPDRGLP